MIHDQEKELLALWEELARTFHDHREVMVSSFVASGIDEPLNDQKRELVRRLAEPEEGDSQ